MRLLWKSWIAALVLAGVVGAVTDGLRPANGELGFSVRTAGQGLTIDAVVAGSPAARSGLRVGEQIQVERSFDDLVRWSTLRAGDAITLVREDGSRLTLVAQPADIPVALGAVIVAMRLSFLLVAALVAWRRPDDGAARALSTFLACFGVAINLGDGLWGGGTIARFLAILSNGVLFSIGLGAVALFACRFPSSAASGWRRWLERNIIPLVVTGVALNAATTIGAFVFHLDASTKRLFTTIDISFYVAMLVAALSALVGSYRSATGANRVRMLWVLGTFAIGFSGLIAQLIGTSAYGATPPALSLAPITIIAIPIGLAYVILRHRIIDLGFVINRAVVYSVVSVVIVGAFILFEWVVTHVVEAQSSASTILQLAAALALGLSARFIHTYIDRYVDDFFFRDRHLAEAAIRRFAHEALLITDPADLTTKTVDVAQEKARLAAAAFYARVKGRYVALRSTFERAPDVDENDYAVLDMRTWHQRVELLDRASNIPGEIVFPMIVRGKLLGFLACGAKVTHEAFAPDERDALALLARDAGMSLDSLRVRAIERELDGLAHDTEISAAMRARLAGLVAPD